MIGVFVEELSHCRGSCSRKCTRRDGEQEETHGTRLELPKERHNYEILLLARPGLQCASRALVTSFAPAPVPVFLSCWSKTVYEAAEAVMWARKRAVVLDAAGRLFAEGSS